MAVSAVQKQLWDAALEGNLASAQVAPSAPMRVNMKSLLGEKSMQTALCTHVGHHSQ